MKFYKCSKSLLKWKELPQVSYKWKMPILVNTELEVVLGNSLKDSLSDPVFVIMMDNNQREVLYQAFESIETCIAQENSLERISLLEEEIKNYLIIARKPAPEFEPLVVFKERECVSQENYIEPPPYNFNKHKESSQTLFNGGNLLFEEFREEEIKKEDEIEVDLEILKELL